MWDPTQTLDHLGLRIDTVKGLFMVTPTRLKKIKDLAKTVIYDSVKKSRLVPTKLLASFVGLAQSAYLAVAPARFYLRELHNVFKTL